DYQCVAGGEDGRAVEIGWDEPGSARWRVHKQADQISWRGQNTHRCSVVGQKCKSGLSVKRHRSHNRAWNISTVPKATATVEPCLDPRLSACGEIHVEDICRCLAELLSVPVSASS